MKSLPIERHGDRSHGINAPTYMIKGERATARRTMLNIAAGRFTERCLVVAFAVLLGVPWVAAQSQPGTLLWTLDGGHALVLGLDGTIYADTAGGFSAITNGNSGPGIKWTFPVAATSDAAIGADGTIYFGNHDGNLYALNPDGSLKWTCFTGGPGACPAIALDGTIYHNTVSFLYAVGPGGVVKWKGLVGNSQDYPSPASIGPDGTIYATRIGPGGDAGLFAFAPDGTRKWTVTPRGSSYGGAPAVGADGAIYMSDGPSFLAPTPIYAFSPAGELVLQTFGGYLGSAEPAIGPSQVVYETQFLNGGLSAFAADGSLLWSNSPSGPYTNWSASTPALDTGGNIYLTWKYALFALDLQGQVKWTLPISLPNFGSESPLISPGGTIYVGGDKLYAIAGTNSLAESSWPMYRQNPQHTGSAERPFFRNPHWRSDGSLSLPFYGHVGRSYNIQCSMNLVDWTTLTTVVPTNQFTEIIDRDASHIPTRFYRAVSFRQGLGP